jgi:hypothetical protein
MEVVRWTEVTGLETGPRAAQAPWEAWNVTDCSCPTTPTRITENVRPYRCDRRRPAGRQRHLYFRHCHWASQSIYGRDARKRRYCGDHRDCSRR